MVQRCLCPDRTTSSQAYGLLSCPSAVELSVRGGGGWTCILLPLLQGSGRLKCESLSLPCGESTVSLSDRNSLLLGGKSNVHAPGEKLFIHLDIEVLDWHALAPMRSWDSCGISPPTKVARKFLCTLEERQRKQQWGPSLSPAILTCYNL